METGDWKRWEGTGYAPYSKKPESVYMQSTLGLCTQRDCLGNYSQRE